MSTMTSSTQAYDLILQIRQVDRKFRQARQQIIILNSRIESLMVRYNRAGRDKRKSVRYASRLQIATVEGVRNMYYEYCKLQCEAMDDLQTALKELTGCEYDALDDYE